MRIHRAAFGEKSRYGPGRTQRLGEKARGRLASRQIGHFPAHSEVVVLLPGHAPQDVAQADVIEIPKPGRRQAMNRRIDTVQLGQDSGGEPPLQITPVVLRKTGRTPRPVTRRGAVELLAKRIAGGHQHRRSQRQGFALDVGDEYRRRIHVDAEASPSGQPRFHQRRAAAAHRVEHDRILRQPRHVHERAHELRKELAAILVQPVDRIAQASLVRQPGRRGRGGRLRHFFRRGAVASSQRRSFTAKLRRQPARIVADRLHRNEDGTYYAAETADATSCPRGPAPGGRHRAWAATRETGRSSIGQWMRAATTPNAIASHHAAS